MSDGSNFSRLLPTVDDSVDAAQCHDATKLGGVNWPLLMTKSSSDERVCFVEIFADTVIENFSAFRQNVTMFLLSS